MKEAKKTATVEAAEQINIIPAPPPLAALGRETIAELYNEAVRLLADPVEGERLRRSAIHEAAAHFGMRHLWRQRQECAALAESERAETQRHAQILAARNAIATADVSTPEAAMDFYRSHPLNWELGNLALVQRKPGAAPEWSDVRRCAGVTTETRRLAMHVKASRVCVLVGDGPDLDALALRFGIPATLTWRVDGIEHRAFKTFAGVFTGALHASVRMLSGNRDDADHEQLVALPVNDPDGPRWIVDPATFSQSMDAGLAGLPELPLELRQTVLDLSATSDTTRRRFFAVMLEGAPASA